MNLKRWYSLLELWERWKKWDLSINDLLQYALDGEFELYEDPTSKPCSINEITDLILYCNENPWTIYWDTPPWSYLIRAEDVFKFEKNTASFNPQKKIQTTFPIRSLNNLTLKVKSHQVIL